MENNDRTLNSNFLNFSISVLGLLSMIVFYGKFNFMIGSNNFPAMLIPLLTLLFTSIDKLISVNNKDKLEKIIRVIAGLLIVTSVFLLSIIVFEYLEVLVVINQDIKNSNSPMIIQFNGNYSILNDWIEIKGFTFELKTYVLLYVLSFAAQSINNILHSLIKNNKLKTINEISTNKKQEHS